MMRTSELFSVRMLGFGFFWAWLFLVAVSPSPLFGQLTGPGGTPFELWELCFRLLALVVVGGVARQLATTRGVWVLAVLSAVFGIAGVAALGLAQNAGMVAAAAYAMGTGSSAARAPLEVCAGAGVTYTVPQRILPEKLQKTAEVFFRVGGIYENAEIVVSDGERDLLRRKREHLAPGEMERLAIPAALLREAAGPLTVALDLGEVSS